MLDEYRKRRVRNGDDEEQDRNWELSKDDDQKDELDGFAFSIWTTSARISFKYTPISAPLFQGVMI